MERELKRNQFLDEEAVDRYLSGQASEIEVEWVERAISFSNQADQMVLRRANIAGMLGMLTASAHGHAYREEAVREALTRLKSRGALAFPWKERLGAWMQEMFVPFHEVTWSTREGRLLTRGSAMQTAERRLQLTPSSSNVRLTIENGMASIGIDLKGWATAPLVAVITYRGSTAAPKENLWESVRTAGTDDDPVFGVSLSGIEPAEYLISAETQKSEKVSPI